MICNDTYENIYIAFGARECVDPASAMYVPSGVCLPYPVDIRWRSMWLLSATGTGAARVAAFY